MTLEVTWRISVPTPCVVCNAKIFPHTPREEYVEIPTSPATSIVVHRGCGSRLQVHQVSIAENCTNCGRGTDLRILVGDLKIPFCAVCLQDEIGLEAPSTEGGEVHRDEQVQQAEHVPDVDVIERVRHLVRWALDPDHELRYSARRELRATAMAPETASLIEDTPRFFAGTFSDEPEYTWDDIPLLQAIAEAEVRNRTPKCRDSCTHRTYYHVNAKRDISAKHHVVTTNSCKLPSCFACLRASRRYELERHEDLLREMIAAGVLRVLEIPCAPEADFNRLTQRLESVARAVRRRRNKATMIVMVDVDRVLVLVDFELELGRFYAWTVPTWSALEATCIPRTPLQLVLRDEDRVFWYETTRRSKKSARPYGGFYRTGKKGLVASIKVQDPVTKATRTKRVRLCPSCREPYDHVVVVHRAWGKSCEECPEVVLLRGDVVYDEAAGVFAAAGPPAG